MSELVIGDSWADIWPEMMGIPATHRQAVRGSHASQWARDLNGMLTRAKRTAAECVIISLLGNDAQDAIADDGHVSDVELADGLRNMRTVVKAVQRSRTIVMLYADPYCGVNAQARVAVPKLNGAIRDACVGLPVVFADLGEWLHPCHFDGVDIHPNREGLAMIAGRMWLLILEVTPCAAS